MTANQWSVWRTVEIGRPGFVTAADFLTVIARKEISMGYYMRTTIVRLAIEGMIPGLLKKNCKIALVRVFASQFKFPGRMSLGEFFRLACEDGLKILPFEAGIYLAIDYEDQPDDEKLHMAVEPVKVEGYGPCGLFLCGKYISGDNPDLGMRILPEFECVFGL